MSTTQPSLFAALQELVKRKQPITNKNVRARLEVQNLFTKEQVKKAIDLSEFAQQAAALYAQADAIKRHTEWRDLALAIHVLHTSCDSCGGRTASTEGLLLKQLNRNGVAIRYQPIPSDAGFEALPYITLNRQHRVPLCHLCICGPNEWQASDPRQASFKF